MKVVAKNSIFKRKDALNERINIEAETCSEESWSAENFWTKVELLKYDD